MCIRDSDTDGHNPHAHILLTVRPLNENGTWQYKTEKEYLCIKDGEEKGFTASEFKKMCIRDRFLTEQQEPERGISELQKLSGIIKEYHSDDCLDSVSYTHL